MGSGAGGSSLEEGKTPPDRHPPPTTPPSPGVPLGSWSSQDVLWLPPVLRGCREDQDITSVAVHLADPPRGALCPLALPAPGFPLTHSTLPACSLQEPQPGGAGLPGRTEAGRGLGPRGHRQERDLQRGRGVEGGTRLWPAPGGHPDEGPAWPGWHQGSRGGQVTSRWASVAGIPGRRG